MAKKSSLSLHKTPYTQVLTAADIYNSVFKEYPDVLSVPEVAEIIGISTKTTYRLLNNGTIESVKIGREFKIPKVFILEYFKLLDRRDISV